jgi:hypothetical protein
VRMRDNAFGGASLRKLPSANKLGEDIPVRDGRRHGGLSVAEESTMDGLTVCLHVGEKKGEREDHLVGISLLYLCPFISLSSFLSVSLSSN